MPTNGSRRPGYGSRQAARNSLRASELDALSDGGARGFRANIDPNDWASAPVDPVDDDLENDDYDLGEDLPDSGDSMSASAAMNRGPDDDSYNEYFDDDKPMFGLDSDGNDNDNTPWRVRHDDEDDGSSGDLGDGDSGGGSRKDNDSKDNSNSRDSKGESNSTSSKDKKSGGLSGTKSKGSDSDGGSSAKKANDNEKSGFYKPSGDKGSKGGKAEKAAAVAGAAAEMAGGKGAGKLSGFKKKGPILGIIALLGGLGFGAASSQLLMPFHVVEQMTEMFDGSFTARHARTPSLMRKFFKLDAENATYKTFFTKKNKYRKDIKPGSKIAKKLSAQGIDVVDSGGKTILRHNGNDISADDFNAMYKNNSEFRNDFDRANRSFLGRIGAFIDLTLARFLDSNTLTKNFFKDWKAAAYEKYGDTASFHDVISNRKPAKAGDAETKTGHNEYEYDKDGNRIEKNGEPVVRPETDSEESFSGAVTDQPSAKQRAESIVGTASTAVSAVCAVGAISAAVSAVKVALAFDQARRYYSNLAESVDKVKAGDGEASPIYQTGYSLSEKDGTGKSALESEGMKLTISGGTYTPRLEDPFVKMMDVSESFKSFGSSIAFTIGCAAVSGVLSVVSVVLQCIPFVGTVAKAGITVANFFKNAALSFVVSQAVTMITNFFVKSATVNLCTEVSGLQRGECMNLGGSNYLGINFQNGGGSPASKEKVLEFYDAHVLALADEAELDRSTRSPFDLTTSHTFLGSIAGKLSILASTSSGLGFINSVSNLVGSSIASILPTASALDKTQYLENQIGECDTGLEVVNAVGNIYCNPIYITDQSVVNKDAEKNSIDLVKNDSFEMDGTVVKTDENGTEIIKADSTLGKYISYCANRTSPLGIVDANIQAAETTHVTTNNSTLDGLLGSVVGAIPIVGDLLGAVESGEQIAVMGWTTGANCVARSGQDSLSVKSEDEGGNTQTTVINVKPWNDEFKSAQLYVSDDRYLQSTDENYKSSVIAYLDRQEAEHPSDGTYVEWLAKQTGLLKEDVQVALNEETYWNYVAQYNPEGKGPMFDNEIEPENNYQVPENMIADDYIERISVAKAWVVYSDNRIQEVTA